MRLRELISTTLISFALTTLNADSAFSDLPPRDRDVLEAPNTKVATPPVAAPLVSKDKLLREAYFDTLSILASTNTCSDFFGGPGVIEVFDELISKARKEYFPRSIGMQLSGMTKRVFDRETKKSYRVFERLSINKNGPFYKHNFSKSEASTPPVGRYQPNTREARVLMLLHELGHAVQAEDGDWLLPDDGKDVELSATNTRKIESVCRDQIRGLSKRETGAKAAKAEKPIREDKE